MFRCAAYGIPEVDQHLVQQYVRRIIPAVATTTAMVSGLLGLELLKLAAVKADLKKASLNERAAFSTFSKTRPGIVSNMKRLLKFAFGKLRASHQTETHNSLESKQVLGKFRNSFINLDGPEISYAEPLAAEDMPLVENDASKKQTVTSFTLWDKIEVR